MFVFKASLMHVDALGDPWDDIGSGATLEVSEVTQGHLTDEAVLEQGIACVFTLGLLHAALLDYLLRG